MRSGAATTSRRDRDEDKNTTRRGDRDRDDDNINTSRRDQHRNRTSPQRRYDGTADETTKNNIAANGDQDHDAPPGRTTSTRSNRYYNKPMSYPEKKVLQLHIVLQPKQDRQALSCRICIGTSFPRCFPVGFLHYKFISLSCREICVAEFTTNV